MPDTDIFAGYSLRPEQLVDARKLQWIHSTAAGVAQLRYPELRDSGIVVKNPSEIFSVPMAEHTMGLLLALARNFPDSVRHQEHAHWGQQEMWDQPQRLTEWNAQVLLIVGYGSIGRELARRATAFEMRVWGVTRSGQGDTTYAEIVPVSELHQVLPHADFVVRAPETPETGHLIVFHSGLSGASGSIAVTSSAAPPSFCSFSARTSAISSSNEPRNTFTTLALGFIRASSAAPTGCGSGKPRFWRSCWNDGSAAASCSIA